MHTLVVLRLVPNFLEDLPFDGTGALVDRENMGCCLNEFDDYALEEAILFKEANGGAVTALGVRSYGIDRVLQNAIARGADRAVRLEVDDDMTRSRDLALAVARAIDALKPDLVLTGIQTPEDQFGQLAPLVGEGLRWPHLSGVTGITVGEASAVRVQQEYGNGRGALLDVDLPAVIGVQAASKPPRYVSGSRLRQAIQTTRIESLAVAGERSASPQGEVMNFREAVRGPGAEMIEGTPEEVADRLIALLTQHGFLKVPA